MHVCAQTHRNTPIPIYKFSFSCFNMLPSCWLSRLVSSGHTDPSHFGTVRKRMFKAWGWYRDSPGTAMKYVLEPSFASLAVFRRSNVLCCSSGAFFKEKKAVHTVSVLWVYRCFILRDSVPVYPCSGQGEVNFSRSPEGHSPLPGDIRSLSAIRCGHGRGGSFSGFCLVGGRVGDGAWVARLCCTLCYQYWCCSCSFFLLHCCL